MCQANQTPTEAKLTEWCDKRERKREGGSNVAWWARPKGNGKGKYDEHRHCLSVVSPKRTRATAQGTRRRVGWGVSDSWTVVTVAGGRSRPKSNLSASAIESLLMAMAALVVEVVAVVVLVDWSRKVAT
ncbi:hypothetical protein ACLKA7_006415 [Drosophila subpalustris]